MMETQVADRRYRISHKCLIAAISCVVATLLGCYLVLANLPKKTGWDGLGDLMYTLLGAFGGLMIAACIALASLGYGIACARHKKRVLWWVVPLWLAAASGLVAGLVQLMVLADEKHNFITGGKQDDLAYLFGVWLGWVNLLYLAYWIATVVCGKRLRLFRWWSIPLWAIALTGALFLFG